VTIVAILAQPHATAAQPCAATAWHSGVVGLLRWLRVGNSPVTAAVASGLEEIFSPARHRAREQLHSLSMRRDDDGDSDGHHRNRPYQIDLDARTALRRRPFSTDGQPE
jgi:hypothetical protein